MGLFNIHIHSGYVLQDFSMKEYLKTASKEAVFFSVHFSILTFFLREIIAISALPLLNTNEVVEFSGLASKLNQPIFLARSPYIIARLSWVAADNTKFF